MTTHIGFDVSKWQDPMRWDWPALKQQNEALKRQGLPGLLLIARATYGANGANCVDPTFRTYARMARDGGLVFGAYHFYRQVHSVEDQLDLFEGELRGIGGLRPGELVPVLDLEGNEANGDGAPDKRFRDGARQMGKELAARYGGCLLYYSSYFPEHLGAPKSTDWIWVLDPQFRHFVADYSVPDGKPRTPYLPKPAIHQPRPRVTGWYDGGKAKVDHIYLVDQVALRAALLPDATPPTPAPSRSAALVRAAKAARELADALAAAAGAEE